MYYKIKKNQNSTELRGIIGYLKLNDNILNPNDFLIIPSEEYNIFSQNLSGTYVRIIFVKCIILF